MKDFASDLTEQIEASYCSIVRECDVFSVCVWGGWKRENERAEGERNIFSTVGGSPSGAAVLCCQHRAAGTGRHPLHFDAAHLGTENKFGLQRKMAPLPFGLCLFLFLSLPHPSVFSDDMMEEGTSLLNLCMIIFLSVSRDHGPLLWPRLHKDLAGFGYIWLSLLQSSWLPMMITVCLYPTFVISMFISAQKKLQSLVFLKCIMANLARLCTAATAEWHKRTCNPWKWSCSLSLMISQYFFFLAMCAGLGSVWERNCCIAREVEGLQAKALCAFTRPPRGASHRTDSLQGTQMESDSSCVLWASRNGLLQQHLSIFLIICAKAFPNQIWRDNTTASLV